MNSLKHDIYPELMFKNQGCQVLQCHILYCRTRPNRVVVNYECGIARPWPV